MAVTEPETGTETTRTRTTAVRKGDHYVVDGEKVWIGRIQHSDLMILLARTTPLEDVAKRSEGLSIFLVDLREAIGHGMDVRPIENMVDAETNEVTFDGLEIPAENLIGEEGKGLTYLFDGLNAERTLIAAECIGDGYWFVEHAVERANSPRRVRAADRAEPGCPVPDRRGLHAGARGRPDAVSRLRAVRCRPALRSRGKHGEAPRGKGLVGGRQRLRPDLRRLRLRCPLRRSSGSSGRPGSTRCTDLVVTSCSPTSAERVLGMPRSY